MTSWARIEPDWAAHDAEPKKEEPKWAHVEEEPENKDQLAELCCDIDKAYEKYKQKKLYFGMFYNLRTDMKIAEYLFAVSEMQKCMGELSEESCDIFRNTQVDCGKMERVMGRILFYMEVAMMSHGKDLTDARDECDRICRGIEMW